MTLAEIQPHKIFETIAGSHAYGLATLESDTDIRGVFCLPADAFISLQHPPKQVADERNDVVFYELRQYLALAADCNPNIIELLWSPADCVRFRHHLMDRILERRSDFISKKAYHTFSGYAYSQIKRARGQNKWVNNPKPETPPQKESYCYIISAAQPRPAAQPSLLDETTFPCRPVALSDIAPRFDLKRCHCAAVEHGANLYRLYNYGDDAKGVFRGDQLVCESIPKADEWSRFCGLLLYNQQEYERALKDWKSYWEWRENRNDARYVSQERGEIDYDAKNMMHCMRLLWSGRNILENGEPLVRFTGQELQQLIDIRAGKYPYDELIAWVEREMVALDELKERSRLPESSNMKRIDRLYRQLMAAGEMAGGKSD